VVLRVFRYRSKTQQKPYLELAHAKSPCVLSLSLQKHGLFASARTDVATHFIRFGGILGFDFVIETQ
jgi:hypothetical protein